LKPSYFECVQVQYNGQPKTFNRVGVINFRIYRMQPKDFSKKVPLSSVFQRAECENLACRILHFTETWEKPLTWEEYYETMTQADKNVASAVKRDFERVMPYLASAEKCATFSPAWRKLFESNQAG